MKTLLLMVIKKEMVARLWVDLMHQKSPKTKQL
jgi:hypothetical protein